MEKLTNTLEVMRESLFGNIIGKSCKYGKEKRTSKR